MPHPDDWVDQHVSAHEELGSDGCSQCHDAEATGTARTDCDTCHHPGGDVAEPWVAAHSAVVNMEGTQDCESCHSSTQFCTACHGVELPHPPGWIGMDHAIAWIEDGNDTCGTCHDTTGEDGARTECDRCHHPSGNPDVPWIIAHRGALADEDANCFACHAQATCVSCHVDGVAEFSADWERIVDLGA